MQLEQPQPFSRMCKPVFNIFNVEKGFGGGLTVLVGPDGLPLIDNSYKYGELCRLMLFNVEL